MSSIPPSPILQLPAELRVRIYNYAFVSLPSPVHDYTASATECEPIELLQTCRQSRAEANIEFAKVLEKQEIELLAAQNKVTTELKAREDEECLNSPTSINGWWMLCSLDALAYVSAAKRELAEVKEALWVVGILKARSEKRVSSVQSGTSEGLMEE